MNKKKFVTILVLALSLLAILSTLTGCFGSTAPAAGWAGVTVSGDSVYTVSSQGQLVALALADFTKEPNWTAAVEGIASSGGFLSCSAPSIAVAVYGTPVVSGDMIYVAGYNGKVYSYSISKQSESSNALLDQDDSKPIVGGPAVGQGKVYVASSNGNLYALDATTLAQIWKFPTGNKIWSTPAVDDGMIFVGSFDKKVYAVDAATGKQKWSFDSHGAVLATPLIDDGTVYVASFDRHIYALDEATGSLKWQFPAANQSGNEPREWFWATPVISNGILYATCLDGNVYAVKTQDGSLVATFDLGAEVSSSPVVVDSKVIVATHDAKIYSLDASGAKTQLLLVNLRDNDKDNNPSKLIVSSPLSAANGVVFIHGLQSDRIYALDLVTKNPTPSEILTGVASSSSTITVPTTVVVTTIVTTTVTVTATVTVTK